MQYRTDDLETYVDCESACEEVSCLFNGGILKKVLLIVYHPDPILQVGVALW